MKSTSWKSGKQTYYHLDAALNEQLVEACAHPPEMNSIHTLGVRFSPAKFSSSGSSVDKANDWVQPGGGFTR